MYNFKAKTLNMYKSVLLIWLVLNVLRPSFEQNTVNLHGTWWLTHTIASESTYEKGRMRYQILIDGLKAHLQVGLNKSVLTFTPKTTDLHCLRTMKWADS